MSSQNVARVDPRTDPYGFLRLIKNPDGSITRLPTLIPASSPSSDPGLQILTKDVSINQDKCTWARVYLPNPKPESTEKLPLIVYFHGGGFVIGSASSAPFHKFLLGIGIKVPAVIVSVEYRLAPEHRLPAAYDDSIEALHWIKTTNDDWLTKYADLSKCFLMGTSAGGTIAYHIGTRMAACVDDLAPLKIRGLILHQPFFGGVQRTPSELRLIDDERSPLVLADLLWELALPVNTDRDHEYCNPMAEMNLDVVEKMKYLKWKVLVTGYDGDPLVDRQRELVKMLETHGVNVIGEFRDGGYHGYEFGDEPAANILYEVVNNFIIST